MNRVSSPVVEEYLLDEIKAAKWLDAGAQAAGAKVHKLPATPADVPDDGELRFVILGPGSQSESGKPSALATKFCDETTGANRPRSNKNAIIIAVPSRTGLDVTRERIRDFLAWREVKTILGEVDDPTRKTKLLSSIEGCQEGRRGATPRSVLHRGDSRCDGRRAGLKEGDPRSDRPARCG